MFIRSVIRSLILLLLLSSGLKGNVHSITSTPTDKTTFILSKIKENASHKIYTTGCNEAVKLLKAKQRNKKGVKVFVPKINEPARGYSRTTTSLDLRPFSGPYLTFFHRSHCKRGPPVA